MNDNIEKVIKATVVLAASTVAAGAGGWFLDKKIRRIAKNLFGNSRFLILGMKASGKSKFKSCIANAIEVPDDDLHIKMTFDAKKMEYDYIVFIFSVPEYIEDVSYKKRTNAYLDFLYRHKKDEDIYIFGSHYEPVNKEKLYHIKTELLSEEKEYAKILENRFFGINLINENQIESILNRIKSLSNNLL